MPARFSLAILCRLLRLRRRLRIQPALLGARNAALAASADPVLSVADRINELRRTKKRPAQAVANWIARERRRGNYWLADSIAEQAGIVVPKPEPAVALAKPKYWWQDD